MNNSISKRKSYTLVELLVAMAVLVIMMGFLFQFIIGAQRIWTGSSRQSTAFEYSNVVFDVLGTDLGNMQFSTNPGASMPFYLRKDADGNIYMAFFSDFKSSTIGADAKTKVGTFPVVYYFSKAKGKVYRCAIDDTDFVKNGSSFTINNIWYLFGAEYGGSTDFFGSFCHEILDTASQSDLSSLDQFDMLAEDVNDFNVDVLFGTADDSAATRNFDPSSSDRSKHYATSRPRIVRIRLAIDNNKSENDKSTTERSFSKVIFL